MCWRTRCPHVRGTPQLLHHEQSQLSQEFHRRQQTLSQLRGCHTLTPHEDGQAFLPLQSRSLQRLHRLKPDMPLGAAASNHRTLEDSVSESGEIIGSTHSDHSSTSTQQRRGRAPPIEFFSGENPAIAVDDWLPSLEHASSWNGWSTSEKLMELPSYLKGRALQEWRLLSHSEQQDFTMAINTLGVRLDPGSKTMAAKDFWHSLQKSGENMPDFIRQLRRPSRLLMAKITSTAQPETRYSMVNCTRGRAMT